MNRRCYWLLCNLNNERNKEGLKINRVRFYWNNKNLIYSLLINHFFPEKQITQESWTVQSFIPLFF